MWGRFLTWLVTVFLAKHFPDRYRVIPRRSDGEPLLRQFKITDWLYLQSFENPEERNLFHVHRWKKMYSFVLSGRFREERYPGVGYAGGPFCGCCYLKMHEAPSIYTMDNADIHRLDYVAPNTWTLFAMRGNMKQWGYYPRPDDTGYTTWEEAIPDERKMPSWSQR